MRESLYPIKGSDVVFVETFNSLTAILRNGGVAVSPPTIDDGVADFIASGSNKIIYPPKGGIKSLRFLINLDSTTENILKLSSSHSVTVSGGTLSATGFSSPTIYVDNSATSAITTGWREVIITTATAIAANDIQLGYVSAYGDFKIDSLEFCARQWTAAEVSNLYHKMQYKGLVRDGLVGYWDFTKGSSFDRSRNGNNGVDTLGAGGYKKQGLECDGANTKVDISNSTNMQVADGSFTVGMVLNFDQFIAQDNLCGIETSVASSKGWVLRTTLTAPNIVVNDTSGAISAIGGTTLTSSVSYYLVGVVDRVNNILSLYLNGNKDLVDVDITGLGTLEKSIGLQIGNVEDTAGKWYKGIIKATHLHNRDLSAEEMAQNYQFFKTNFNL